MPSSVSDMCVKSCYSIKSKHVCPHPYLQSIPKRRIIPHSTPNTTNSLPQACPTPQPPPPTSFSTLRVNSPSHPTPPPSSTTLPSLYSSKTPLLLPKSPSTPAPTRPRPPPQSASPVSRIAGRRLGSGQCGSVERYASGRRWEDREEGWRWWWWRGIWR